MPAALHTATLLLLAWAWEEGDPNYDPARYDTGRHPLPKRCTGVIGEDNNCFLEHAGIPEWDGEVGECELSALARARAGDEQRRHRRARTE